VKVPGLTLAEQDFIALAEDLAIKDGAHWRRLSTSKSIGRRSRPRRG
jgi:hypothetical protein